MEASLWWPASQLVGWTLVHFLWQGALLGLVYVVLRSAVPRGAARYWLGMATLFALALCPLLTLWALLGRIPDTVAADPVTTLAAVADSGAVADVAGAKSAFDALLPWLVLAWSLGVALHFVQAWRQWRALKALVRVAESIPRWQQRAARMAQRFGLQRRVTVLASRVVATPVLIGWLRPVILLPMAVVCGFPASQIELILAHELAHLRRWDPLANLFQLALETLYFYHPVVRWISRDVSNEREICCDQLALALGGGDRREFVTVLTELGELRERQNGFLLAANGGALLDRVELMMLPGRQVAQARKGAYVVALALAAALVVLTLRLQWVQAQLEARMDSTVIRLRTLLLPVPLPAPASLAAIRLTDLPMLSLHLAGTERDASKRDTGLLSSAGAFSPMKLPQAPFARVATPVLMPAWRVPPVAATRVAAPSIAVTPTPTYVRQPVYPHTASRQGLEGEVVVEFSLAKDGSVRGLRAISANPVGVFEQSALDAVHDWRYAVPEGATSGERYRQTVAFTLNRPHIEPHARDSMRDVQARSDCQVVTGTHICRWLDDATVPVQVLRHSGAGFR